jgi:hypothetical protein
MVGISSKSLRSATERATSLREINYAALVLLVLTSSCPLSLPQFGGCASYKFNLATWQVGMS